MASEPRSIRVARSSDRTSMLAVVASTGLFGDDELAEVAASLDHFLAGDAADDRWLVDDDAADGLTAVAYYAPERMTEGTWNLYLLAVGSSHQGEGRGAALVREVERLLAAAGARLLLIETSGVADFAPQRAFYAGLGYQEQAWIRDFYQAGDAKVIFCKPLSASRPPADRALIRIAESSDLAELRRLAEAFYRAEGFSTPPSSLADNLRRLIVTPTARVAVADGGGGLAAFAITTTSFGLESGSIAELEDLFTDPASRRKGLAAALIADAARWAAYERGCFTLDVVIAPNGRNVEHLHAYYSRHGFGDDGRRLRSRDLREPDPADA